jgi:hypothetical protein
MTRAPARFHPLRAITDAALLFLQPRHAFEPLTHPGPLLPSVLQILFWGTLAAALDALAMIFGLRPGSNELLPNLIVIVIGGPFFLFISAIFTLAFHGLARAAGDTKGLKTSFRIIGVLMPLMTIDILFGRIPFIRIPFLLYKFYLAFLAAQIVHQTPRKRALYAFGTAFTLVFLLNLKSWISG